MFSDAHSRHSVLLSQRGQGIAVGGGGIRYPVGDKQGRWGVKGPTAQEREGPEGGGGFCNPCASRVQESEASLPLSTKGKTLRPEEERRSEGGHLGKTNKQTTRFAFRKELSVLDKGAGSSAGLCDLGQITYPL